MRNNITESAVMRTRNRRAGLIVAMAVGVFPAVAPARAGSTPLAGLLNQVNTDRNVPDRLREFINKHWADCNGCDEEEFFTQTLATLSDEFRDGLDAYDADAYDKCADLMSKLRAHENRYIALNAEVYQLKALVGAERFKSALERIEQMIGSEIEDIRSHTYFATELAFLRGYCLLSDLQFDAASEALQRFLEDYPEAPARLRASAGQMLSELDTRKEGQIGEVTDLMNFSARRLAQNDSGEEVQTRQKRIVELLDKLIDEAQNREQNQQNSSSRNNQPDGAPSQPKPQSDLPPGGQSEQGPLRPSRIANPGEVWGNMPPAERERIMQALKESFPSKYRALLEQYYEELAKRP